MTEAERAYLDEAEAGMSPAQRDFWRAWRATIHDVMDAGADDPAAAEAMHETRGAIDAVKAAQRVEDAGIIGAHGGTAAADAREGRALLPGVIVTTSPVEKPCAEGPAWDRATDALRAFARDRYRRREADRRQAAEARYRAARPRRATTVRRPTLRRRRARRVAARATGPPPADPDSPRPALTAPATATATARPTACNGGAAPESRPDLTEKPDARNLARGAGVLKARRDPPQNSGPTRGPYTRVPTFCNKYRCRAGRPHHADPAGAA